MGQTFLSASWGDFPVAPRPDWKVRRTGRLESLPYIRGLLSAVSRHSRSDDYDFFHFFCMACSLTLKLEP